MINSYWGDASRSVGAENIVLNSGSGNDMNEPSMVCDTQGRVWVVSYEGTTGDIWFDMEDFQDGTYWPGPFIITAAGENINPTISYDSSGTVYCVWQHTISANDYGINISYNSSGSWSTPLEITSGSKNIYPQIPENLTIFDNLVGFICKDDTSDNLMFHSIPEFSDFIHFIIIILFIQMLALTIEKRISKMNISKNRSKD
jgi:hypothetical protein